MAYMSNRERIDSPPCHNRLSLGIKYPVSSSIGALVKQSKFYYVPGFVGAALQASEKGRLCPSSLGTQAISFLKAVAIKIKTQTLKLFQHR
ncbi:MAG: hypothetical protein COB51_09385 [Moraxellaceae bacterium]|nr:MAG: hypothetical protein COB51_09385 [Moraxellaceae bacterium]